PREDNMRPRRTMIAAFALTAASAACTLLLDRSKEQCSTNADCIGHLGAGATCVDSVCTGGSGPGTDGGGTDGQADGQAEAAPGPDACGTPTNNDELLNACTNAQCVPFDNCDKLG